MKDLNTRIEAAVRAWPQWSRAERGKMELVVEEILEHCRSGNGNGFIRWWCEHNLPAIFIKGSK